jgi:hypothetical protein
VNSPLHAHLDTPTRDLPGVPGWDMRQAILLHRVDAALEGDRTGVRRKPRVTTEGTLADRDLSHERWSASTSSEARGAKGEKRRPT